LVGGGGCSSMLRLEILVKSIKKNVWMPVLWPRN